MKLIKKNIIAKIRTRLGLVITAVILLSAGVIFGLNGYFGGGDTIPKDTFNRGLVGYWSFDEGTGSTAYDASGNNNDGTLSYDPQWTDGKHGGALNFDGVNDCVYKSSFAFLGENNADFTFSAWVRWTGNNYKGQELTIMSQAATRHWFSLDQNKKLSLWTRNLANTSYQTTVSDAAVPKNEWTFVVGSYDSSLGKQRVYINGELAKESNYSGTLGYLTTFKVGTTDSYNPGGSYQRFFNGQIDEAKVYNRALTLEEIRYHYNRGGPVAHWKMDEGSGTKVYDESNNNNEGTLVVGSSGANATTSDAWVNGKHGSALSFDGTDDYVDSGDVSSEETLYTVAFWFKTNGSGEIFRRGNAARCFYNPRIVSSGSSISVYESGCSGSGIIGNIGISLDTWHFITVTRNGETVKFYLDGTLVAQDTSQPDPSGTDGKTIIGAAYHSDTGISSSFNGLVDDVRIYSYARTAEEIRLDYNTGFATYLGTSGKSCSEDPANCMDYGLVGSWGLNEGSGNTAYDASGNGNDGTLTNDPHWTKGKEGKALQFDGTNDYVNCGNDAGLNIGTHDYSVTAWVKTSEAANLRIVSKYNPFNLYVDTNGRFELQLYDGTWLINGQESSSSINDNKWHHVVWVLDRDGNSTFYIDGTQDGTPVDASSFKDTDLSFSDYLYIGVREPTFAPFDGNIDEVKIYNRALSAEEVRYHYNKGAPIAHWKMDEGSGSTIYDESHNNNGTISGATWANGKHGSALSFDGSNDYVDCGTDSSLLWDSGDGTVCAWIKTAFKPTAENGIFLKGWDYRYAIYIEENGYIEFAIDDNTTAREITGTTDLTNDAWHFVCGRRNGDAFTVWADGIEESSITYSGYGSLNDSNIARIGQTKSTSPGSYFNGLIDDVRIYNYARTAEQIKLDYNAGLATHLGASDQSCSEDPASCMDYGLVGNWPMDENSGTTAYDSSDSGNDATISGATWVDGKHGNALQFDGNGDNLNTDNFLNLSNDFTYSFWYKKDSPIPQWSAEGDVSKCVLVYNSYGSGRMQACYRDRYCNNGIRFRSASTGNHAWCTGSLDVGRYYYIVFTKTMASQKLYIDGEVVASTTGAPEDMTASQGFDVYNGFSGLIDDARVYNRALSAEEIRYHYNKGLPIAHWKMDEGEGSKAYDETSNNNDGTISGATWVEGKHGSSLSFDGADDYVGFPTDQGPISGTGSFTLASWVKTTSDGERNIVQQRDSEDTAGEYEFEVNNGNVNYYDYSSDYGLNFSSAGTINDGSWHYVVLVRDGDNGYIYIDGIQDGTDSATAINILSSRDFAIGKDLRDNSDHFNGLIDDIRIYNYVRTPEQILMDYNNGFATHFK